MSKYKIHSNIVKNQRSNIVIDAGNSSIKIGEFVDSRLIGTTSFTEVSQIVPFLRSKNIQRIIISSVARQSVQIAEEIGSVAVEEINIFGHSTPIPFENHYKTKETLGLDRLAGLAGAQQLFPGQNALVIDIGTCITYDMLVGGQHYFGGSISPGVDMRFRAMHEFTERLPMVSAYGDVDLVGDSTIGAMTSGVILGIIAELQGIIAQYNTRYPQMVVLVCGGGAKRFESNLKEPIFALPELVLVGLNRILEYNE